MESYIGTKTLRAKPLTRGEYNSYRDWNIPENEDPNEQGYLVEYQDGGKPNDNRHEGYISWSPKDVFEKAYKKTNGLSFGLAIELLKQGKKVARQGWNGKGMWIVLVPGTPCAELKEGTPYYAALEKPSCEILPHIDMWTTNSEGRRAMLPGWVASQTDILSEDWQVID